MSQAHGYPDASFVPAADYSAKQYYAVKFGSSANQVTLAGANEKAIGFLQNKPEADEIAHVRCGGFSKAVIGEASLSIGDTLTPTAAGKLEQVDAAGEWTCAILVDDGGGSVADGDILEVFIVHYTSHASDA